MRHDPLHPVQEPAVDARELVQPLHRVAGPQSCRHHEDALVGWRLQLLTGRADRWIRQDCGEGRVQMLRLTVPIHLQRVRKPGSSSATVLGEEAAEEEQEPKLCDGKTCRQILALCPSG